MKNIVSAEYDATGKSLSIDEYGMREMQRRVYAKYDSQHILLKAPPASGKSRALMYVALEKLRQGLVKKIIVAVPERSIAKSFESVNLTNTGFHSDWTVLPRYDLCTPGGDQRKSLVFKEFMESDEKILICTHSTLRSAFDQIGAEAFNDCLVAIDEFHHVSSDTESKLGQLIRTILYETNAHILAMTGSYFRGDSLAILSPTDELKFTKVTYNYYEQLNGYEHLKSLGIGFSFYTGSYLDAIPHVLDVNKKTIIHIPSVNAAESTKEKIMEVDTLIDHIGTYESTDQHGIIRVRNDAGTIVKIADLVTDSPQRESVMAFLRNVKHIDDIDIIIALGMAKEGFDWPYCEVALTAGYRGSLTEIIQIIGRCTRDSVNKQHAQFINLVAEPDADSEDVIESVNNILKAIAASLLMEEVMAPKYTFKAKSNGSGEKENDVDIYIDGFKEPTSPRVKEIIENDLIDLKAKILQSTEIQNSMPGIVDPEVLNKALIPKVIQEVYPDLSESDLTELSDYVVVSSVVRASNIVQQGNNKLITFAGRLVNVNELNMDLINSINPFQNAYAVMSKELSPRVFKAVQQCIQALKIQMTDDEAKILWFKIQDFYKIKGKAPSFDAIDPLERRMAEALVYLRQISNEQLKD